MKKWLSNFWYHYKWPTIIISFFLVIAIICSVQIFTKDEYDVCILYVGDTYMNATDYAEIKTMLEKELVDYNGDGKTLVDFSYLQFMESDKENAGYVNGTATEFLQNLPYSSYYIVIMAEYAYDVYKDSGVFAAINEVYPNADSEAIYDETALKLSGTTLAMSCPGMRKIAYTDGIEKVVCLKKVPYTASAKKQKLETELYKQHAEYLANLLEID